MKRWIVCVILCSISSVAVTAGGLNKDRQKTLNRVNYVAYQGEQQAWPTGGKTVPKTIDTKQGVTIYRSLPGRAYEILGVIQIADGSKITKRIAEAAQATGANAVLACADDTFVKAGITIKPNLVMEGERARSITALTGFLIRWKLGGSTVTSPAPTNATAAAANTSPPQ